MLLLMLLLLLLPLHQLSAPHFRLVRVLRQEPFLLPGLGAEPRAARALCVLALQPKVPFETRRARAGFGAPGTRATIRHVLVLLLLLLQLQLQVLLVLVLMLAVLARVPLVAAALARGAAAAGAVKGVGRARAHARRCLLLLGQLLLAMLSPSLRARICNREGGGG